MEWLILGFLLFLVFVDGASNSTETELETSANVTTQNIVITSHPNISQDMIMFKISNGHLFCGGMMYDIEITDNAYYKNQYIHYTMRKEQEYYAFYSILSQSFTPPISIKITKMYDGDSLTIVGRNVITSISGNEQFDFGSNFCLNETEQANNAQVGDIKDYDEIASFLQILFYHFYGLIIFMFGFVGILSLIDAKYWRQNDFYNFKAVVVAMLQILDVCSDVFFIVDVWYKHYYQVDMQKKQEYFAIFVGCIIFMVLPVLISIYQLSKISTKYWMYDNKIRLWLLSNGGFLYLFSFLMGSSFSSIQVFNSHLFGLNLFDMGLTQRYLLSWDMKKIYSVVLFENIPQLLLQTWCCTRCEINFITAVSMMMSSLSIIMAFVNYIIHRKLYYTQDYIEITIDITGQSVIDNQKQCKKRMKMIKKYLASNVFGIDADCINIRKPVNISNGLQLIVFISYRINDDDEAGEEGRCYRAVERKFNDLLNKSIYNEGLHKVVMNEWDLEMTPRITNKECVCRKSKMEQRKSRSGYDNQQDDSHSIYVELGDHDTYDYKTTMKSIDVNVNPLHNLHLHK